MSEKLPYELNKKSIKYYVRNYILSKKESFLRKKILDFPAGNGITSRIIRENGGIPVALDLFPGNFDIPGIKCRKADISKGLPLKPRSVDHAICQEGIEHFADQLGALKELNRVMKPKGTLLITAPNYSNLKSRFSYLVNESENYNRQMPPNEIDSIWLSESKKGELYFGHIFLIGFFRLRVLAKLAGFKLIRIHKTRTKTSSVLLFILFYPLIVLFSWLNYRKNLRAGNKSSAALSLYKDLFRYSISPTILLDSHLMLEFVKENEHDEVAKSLSGVFSGKFVS